MKAIRFSLDRTTTRNDYRDHSRSKQIMAQAVREAYSDIFLIKEHPTTADRSSIEGKLKSFHNASDNVAGLMSKTFFGLLALADLSAKGTVPPAPKKDDIVSPDNADEPPPALS